MPAKSKAQQRFMGMVRAAQKGEAAASGDVAKAAKSMSKKDVKDFASTKHDKLPEKVNEAHFKHELRLDEAAPAVALLLKSVAAKVGPALAKKALPMAKQLVKQAAPHLKQAGKEAALQGIESLAQQVISKVTKARAAGGPDMAAPAPETGPLESYSRTEMDDLLDEIIG